MYSISRFIILKYWKILQMELHINPHISCPINLSENDFQDLVQKIKDWTIMHGHYHFYFYRHIGNKFTEIFFRRWYEVENGIFHRFSNGGTVHVVSISFPACLIQKSCCYTTSIEWAHSPCLKWSWIFTLVFGKV